MHTKAVFDLVACVVHVRQQVLGFELSFRPCMVVSAVSPACSLALWLITLGESSLQWVSARTPTVHWDRYDGRPWVAQPHEHAHAAKVESTTRCFNMVAKRNSTFTVWYRAYLQTCQASQLDTSLLCPYLNCAIGTKNGQFQWRLGTGCCLKFVIRACSLSGVQVV